MRQFLAACVMLLFAAGICAAEGPAFKTQKEKASYIIGILVARDMLGKGVDLDSDIFYRGFKDGLSGAKPAVSDEEARVTMQALEKELNAKREAQLKKAAAENKKQEQAFMAENAKKPGVKTLPSGLQYKVLKEGSGSKATLYDRVTVNYRGTLLNGTEFDSSYKRNQPASFPVNQVIPAWSEALQLMKAGSKWQLFVPAKLAYGEKGSGNVIPPNAALIFEVELLSIGDNPPQAKGSQGKTGAPKGASK